MIVLPPQQIADENGNMTQEMLLWMTRVQNFQVITGSGSPEGVIEAEIGRFYMDTAGTAGAILYIKRDGSDGAGDRSNGWILV